MVKPAAPLFVGRYAVPRLGRHVALPRNWQSRLTGARLAISLADTPLLHRPAGTVIMRLADRVDATGQLVSAERVVALPEAALAWYGARETAVIEGRGQEAWIMPQSVFDAAQERRRAALSQIDGRFSWM